MAILALVSKMPMSQVTAWFANARRRLEEENNRMKEVMGQANEEISNEHKKDDEAHSVCRNVTY